MKKLKFTQAFTLIELVTAMVILMIIAGLIVGVGSSARRKALETSAESMIATLEIAIGMYHMDTGVYPLEIDAAVGGTPNIVLCDYLTNRNHQPDGNGTITYPEVEGWQGPYMEFRDRDLSAGGAVIDPWSTPYNYAIMDTNPAPPTVWGNTGSYNLWSNGPNIDDNSSDGDTEFGDDIHNW